MTDPRQSHTLELL